MEDQADLLRTWSSQLERRKHWSSMQGCLTIVIVFAPFGLAIARQEPAQLLKVLYIAIALFIASPLGLFASATSFFSVAMSMTTIILIFYVTQPIAQWITGFAPHPRWYEAVIPLYVFFEIITNVIISTKERIEWKALRSLKNLSKDDLALRLKEVNLSDHDAKKIYENIVAKKAETIWEKLGTFGIGRRLPSPQLGRVQKNNTSSNNVRFQNLQNMNDESQAQYRTTLDELDELQKQVDLSINKLTKSPIPAENSPSLISNATHADDPEKSLKRQGNTFPENSYPKSMATLKLSDRANRPLPQTPSNPVILLDPDMPSRLGLQAGQITVYQSATLESIAADKGQLEARYGTEIEVLTPDDIFMKELYLLRGDVLANSWLPPKIEGRLIVNGTPVTPLLPLSERIRDLFSSEELCRQCTLGVVSSGDAMELNISLVLPLEGQQVPYQIARSYPIKQANVIDQDLPVIALWPYISDLSWKYYVIFAEDRIAEDRSMGLTVDGFADYQLHTARDGGDAVKYFLCQRFPDLIKLTERNQYRGLIPVKSPSTSLNTSNTWHVGLDFGTSFTNFYINDGSGPERKKLETRVIPLTRGSEEYKLYFLYKFFIPETLLPKDSHPPTLTSLNTYGWQEVPNSTPELFHQARIQWPSFNADALIPLSVRTGFRWHQQQYLRPFLKELALLISSNAACYGATSIDWAVSYPSACSADEAKKYEQLWKSLCQELSSLTGLKQQLRASKSASSSQTGVYSCSLQAKSVAFARYFGDRLNSQLVHAACLDVGDVTTDISIWQDNELIHQVSIPFAGRDIFTKVLQRRPSFIRFLFSPHLTSSMADNEESLRQDPNFSRWIEDCLRYESQDFLSERMPIHRIEGNKQLESFVSLMAISFGGLYHYLGIILKSLSNEGRLRKRAPMPVYLGGNGARFMHWLDESGAFSSGCDADVLMAEVQQLSAAFQSNYTRSPGTFLSAVQGDEIAYGLISREVSLKSAAPNHADAMIAGEDLIINGKLFQALDRISPLPSEDIVTSFELSNLKELRSFVVNYDKAIEVLQINSLLPIHELMSMNELWDEVEITARSYCLERVDRSVCRAGVIPAFLIGLQALLNVLAKEWAGRH